MCEMYETREKLEKVAKSACIPVVSTGRTFRKSGFELLKRGLHKKLRKVENTKSCEIVKFRKSLFSYLARAVHVK